MPLIYLFFDVTVFEVSLILALVFGNPYLPNLYVLIGGFFVLRTLIYYLFFRFLMKREFPYQRLGVQGGLLLTSTFLIIFVIVNVAGLIPTLDPNLFIRYYILTPITALLVSRLIHNFYKLESWQA